MHRMDVITIIAESLPDEQAMDWMLWVLPQEPFLALNHPSVVWWIVKHEAAISRYFNLAFPPNRH